MLHHGAHSSDERNYYLDVEFLYRVLYVQYELKVSILCAEKRFPVISQDRIGYYPILV